MCPSLVLPQPKMTFDPELLDQYQLARTSMDTELSKASLPTPSAWHEFLTAKRSLWWMRDPTFSLEIAFIQDLAGPLGGEMLVAQALDCLPGATPHALNLASVAESLRALEASKAWLFSNPQSRGIVGALLAIVVAMERGEGPAASQFPRGSKMEAAGERLALFCRGEKSSPSAAPMVLYGAAAARLNLAKVQKSIADATLCDLTAVTNCQVFRWLLSVEEAANFDMLSEKAYDIVLRRTSGDAPPDHSEAMGVLVAAASSARIESEGKKASPASRKKGEGQRH